MISIFFSLWWWQLSCVLVLNVAAPRAIMAIVCTWHSSHSHALLTSRKKSHFQFILITIQEDLFSRLSLIPVDFWITNYSRNILCLTHCLTKVLFSYNWIFIYAKFHVIVKGIIFFSGCLSQIECFFVLSILKVDLYAIKFLYLCDSFAKKNF
jgi:hypothetical protein